MKKPEGTLPPFGDTPIPLLWWGSDVLTGVEQLQQQHAEHVQALLGYWVPFPPLSAPASSFGLKNP